MFGDYVEGQITISDYLSSKIKNKEVMDLTAWINSNGKSQYKQIGEVIEQAYERNKDDSELLERLTNSVSVYVLNQSLGYMKYLKEQSEV